MRRWPRPCGCSRGLLLSRLSGVRTLGQRTVVWPGSRLHGVSPRLVWVPASPSEAVGHHALQGVGTLQVEGPWLAATARAGDASWRLVPTVPRGWRREATATDAAGRVVGDYQERGRALRWGSRQLRLGPPSRRTFKTHYLLADGEQVLALIQPTRDRPPLNPINIDVRDAAAIEPGLLLFVAYLVGWLANTGSDANGD
jgi:hypothetical protein